MPIITELELSDAYIIFYYKDEKNKKEYCSFDKEQLEEKIKNIGGDLEKIKKYNVLIRQLPLEDYIIEEAIELAKKDGIEDLSIENLVNEGYIEIELTRGIFPDNAPQIIYDIIDKIYIDGDIKDDIIERKLGYKMKMS